MGAQAVRLSNVDIDNALKNKDFEVLFQPIFDLGNGALARVETFVRWRHPSLGVLPPGAFISFFESQGRMSELTRYVLDQALVEYRAWRGASAPGFSINLALSDLADEAFASHFAVLLRDRGFPADLITLECPMPPVTVELDAATDYFKRLAATGARLAIEVRGRANDFLRQVDPFPFDEIKTGGAAILRFARTVRGPGLSAISELLEISAKANAAITAVGVEDQASLSALRGLGFAAAQGNHLGKVGPLSAFTPARVNEVRQLLGLEPLSPQDLLALFRTEAPAPQPAAEGATESAPAKADGDALVERLAARLARQANAAAPDAPPAEKQAAVTEETAAAAPAPSAASTSAAKAAAIARAKRKVAAKEAASAAAPAPALEGVGEALMEPAAARSLQERLTREFAPSYGGLTPMTAGSSPETGESADEFDFADETPQSQSTGAAQAQRPAAPMNDPEKKRPSKAKAGGSGGEKTEPAAAGAAPAQAPKADVPVAPKANAPVESQEAAQKLAPEAMAQAAAAAQPQQSMARASVAGAQEQVQTSMAVGNARAFFRPGTRVVAMRAIPPNAGGAQQPQPAAPAAATPVKPQPATPAPAATAPQKEPVAAAPASQPEIEAFDDEPAFEDAAAALAEQDFDAEQDFEGEAPIGDTERPKREKNFLTRVVLPYPTFSGYFWPRVFRRTWRRRAAEKARRQAERNTAAD